MTYTAEIIKQESIGDGVLITLSNVKRKARDMRGDYHASVTFELPMSSAKAFPVGNVVTIKLSNK